MSPDDGPAPPDAVATGVWIAAAAIVIMGLRGTFLLMVVPGAALAIVCAVALLAWASHASVLLYDRLLDHRPGRQLLWLIPLGDLAALFLALGLPLAVPAWAGDHELWKDLTGLPPLPFTRLVITLFALVAFQVGQLFLRLLSRYLSDPRSWKSSGRDGLTSLAFAGGLVALACALLFEQARRPQNIAYLRGCMLLGSASRPADALRTFQQIVEEHPDSGLADACLYRIARIEADDMAQPAEAATHLKKLLARWPRSPLADDALHDLGELWLTSLNDLPAAEEAFREVRRRFPRSYLTERAALGLARTLGKAGKRAEAEAVLAELERGPARARVVREDPDARLVVEPLAQAVSAVRRGLKQ